MGLVGANSVLIVFGAELIVLSVRAEPANEQMHLLRPESVPRNQAVMIAANVKHDAVAAIAQQVGRAKRALNIGGRVPVCILQRREPQRKSTPATRVASRIVFHGLALYQVYFHTYTPKVSPEFALCELWAFCLIELLLIP
jgi:hypothetical protein